MHTLSIDLETYSSVSLQSAGVYKYAEAPDFEVLLFGYSADGGPVQVVDLASGEVLPLSIRLALTDDSVIKWAYNASFERVCLSRFLCLPDHRYLNPDPWHCSMVWAAALGLPLSLQDVGAALGLEKQKLTEGKELIRYFCRPCAGDCKRHLPQSDPARWQAFKRYNKRDVETELAIQAKLQRFPLPDSLWQQYAQDQRINDRGVLLDLPLVQAAITLDGQSRRTLTESLRALTGLENPASVQQMKQWLCRNGIITDSLDKKAVAGLLQTASGPQQQVLQLHQQLAKSSVKKYQTMLTCACRDGRVRGCFQFYGANRTGRWAGRLIQLQNLPQNHLPNLAEARSLVRNQQLAALQNSKQDIPSTLSQLIRTAFIPRPGCRFLVADYSAIEARVIAWLAEEGWRKKAFAQGQDIYCASASQMFGVPVEKNGINAHLRQKGKIAELALGYGGSVGALKAMGALEMGLLEEELAPLVDSWRQANPHITALWWDVDEAVMKTVRYKHHAELHHGISFQYQSGMLFITLPSGRRLAYVKPEVGQNAFGADCVTYMGMDVTRKWSRLDSYGPKFVENIVQAIARDILCHAMQALSDCRIVMHIHDELVIEAGPEKNLQDVCARMGQTPSWAEGLLLRADGYECDFYRKD